MLRRAIKIGFWLTISVLTNCTPKPRQFKALPTLWKSTHGTPLPDSVDELAALEQQFQRMMDHDERGDWGAHELVRIDHHLGNLDRALATTALGLSRFPQSAALWHDRGAILALQSAQKSYLLTEAFDALERVPTSDRTLEWYSTAAWVYQRLGLVQRMQEVRDVLKRQFQRTIESTPYTAVTVEGLQRALLQLDEQTLKVALEESPQGLREYIEETWLGAQIPAATRKLQLQLLLRLATQKSPLSILTATLHWADQNPTLIDEQASSFQAFGTARRAYEQQELGDACRLFSEALAAFESSDCPLRYWCLLYLDICAFYEQERFEPDAETRARMREFPEVAARVEWMEGLRLARLNRIAEARTAYAAGYAYAVQSGEVDAMANLNLQQAALEMSIGALDESWDFQIQALGTADQLQRDRSRYKVYKVAIQLALMQERLGFALALGEACRTVAGRTRLPAVAAALLIEDARLQFEFDRPDHTVEVLKRTRQWLDQTADPNIHRQISADADLVEASMFMRQDADVAAQAIARAEMAFRQANNYVNLFHAIAIRTQIQLDQGNYEGAQSSIREIAGMLNTRQDGLDWPKTQTLRRHSRQLVEAWLQQADHRLPASRVSEMMDLCSPAKTPSLCGEASLWMRFFVGQHGVWRIDNLMGHATWQRLALSPQELAGRMRQVQFAMQAGVDRPALWEGLYDALIQLPAGEPAPQSLIIVPDGALWDLPFSALRSGGCGVSLGTLTKVVLAAGSCRQSLEVRDDRVLLVEGVSDHGIPELGLEALPFVADELAGVAELHAPSKTHSVGPTEPDLEASWQEASGIHYSGHAITRFGEGALVVGTGDRADTWTASQIENLDLSGVQWLVLSACKTAPDGRQRTVTSACLAAGAQGVLASMRPVADEGMREFMLAVHRAIASGASLEDAARAGRSACAESAWIGIEVYR